jgi:hypothetical protein
MDQNNFYTEDFKEDMFTHSEFFELEKNNWHTCVCVYHENFLQQDIYRQEKCFEHVCKKELKHYKFHTKTLLVQV